jgi:GAF domain-containing protein
MRARMESSSFELRAHVAEGCTGRVTQGQAAPGNHAINIEHPKSDGFHVKRSDRDGQRRAFPEKRIARRAWRQRLYLSDEGLQVVFGGFTMIGRRHTWSGCNPEMVV